MLCSKPVGQGPPKQTQKYRSHLNVTNVGKVKGDFTRSFGAFDSEYIDLVQRLSQHLHSITDRSMPRRHSPPVSPASAIHKVPAADEVCPNPAISTAGAYPASMNKRMSRRVLKNEKKVLRRSCSQIRKSTPSVQLPNYRTFSTEDDDSADNHAAVASGVPSHKTSDRVSIVPLSARLPPHDATELFYALKTKSISRKNRSSIGKIKVIRVALPEEGKSKQQIRLIQSMRSLQALASKQQNDCLVRERRLDQARSKSMVSVAQLAEQKSETLSAETTLEEVLRPQFHLEDQKTLPLSDNGQHPQVKIDDFDTNDGGIASQKKQEDVTHEGWELDHRSDSEPSANSPIILPQKRASISDAKICEDLSAADFDRHGLPLPKNHTIASGSLRNTQKVKRHPSRSTQARAAAIYLNCTSKRAIFNLGPPSAPPERPLPEIPKGVPAPCHKGTLRGSALNHVSDTAASKGSQPPSQPAQRCREELLSCPTRSKANAVATSDVHQNKLKRNAKISELKRRHMLVYTKRLMSDATAHDVKRCSVSGNNVPHTIDTKTIPDPPPTNTQVDSSSLNLSRPVPPSPSTYHGSDGSIELFLKRGSLGETGPRKHSISLAERNRKSCASTSSSSGATAVATVSARSSTAKQTLTTSKIMTIAETNPDASYGFQSGTLDPGVSRRKSNIKEEESCRHISLMEYDLSMDNRSNSNVTTPRPVSTQNRNPKTRSGYATGISSIKATSGTDSLRHTEQDYQEVLSSHQRLEKRLALARKELEWMGRIYPVMMNACERKRGKVASTAGEYDNSLHNTMSDACHQQNVREPSRSRYRTSRRQHEQTQAKSTLANVERTQDPCAEHNPADNQTLDTNDWSKFFEAKALTNNSRTLGTPPKRSITRDGCTSFRMSVMPLAKGHATTPSTKVRVPKPSLVRKPPFTSGCPPFSTGNDEPSASFISKLSSDDASETGSGRLLPPLKYKFSGTGRLRFDFTSFAFE